MAVWAGVAALFVGVHGQSTTAPTLKIGDPAPEIKEVTWVQGTPVTRLQPGQVYVFEFWATWCGPCIFAMPHLSELAKQYAGKATFVGVSILEDNHGPKGAATSLEKVNTFMQKNPGRMTYNVCVDGGSRQSYMAAIWFRATGQSGIPCTVVVNGAGKVAWIGHPMALDEVLPQVLAGTLDSAKFEAEQKAKRDEARKAREARQALLAPLQTAISQKDLAAFSKSAEALVREHPEIAGEVADLKTGILLDTNDEKALRYHLAEHEKMGRAGFRTLFLIESLADRDGLQPSTHAAAARYLDFALKNMTRAERNPKLLEAIARNYSRAGDAATATSRQARAIEVARNEGRLTETQLQRMEDGLTAYQEAARGSR